MTSLATDVIAGRAIAGSIIGILGTGFLAGLSKARPVQAGLLWLALLFAARIPLLLGPTGFGLIAGWAARHLPTFAAYIAVTASVVSSLWLSLIAVQLVQNAVARFFGAEAEPIRWWAGHQGRRRRRRRRSKA